MRPILLFVFALFLATSCASKKEILYFQNEAALNAAEAHKSFEPIIENNDILYVSISSMNEAGLIPFKRNSAEETQIVPSNPGLQGYLVNSDGNIRFPIIGDLKMSGKSRKEAEEYLKRELTEYVTDVVVDVRIMNFKITVIGEVNTPGVYNIVDERVTLPQALGLAGDLSEDGKRENIMIIREVDGKQQVTRIDITKTDFFSGPYYFLKQNDVVYVEPSNRGVKKSGFIPDVPALLSLFTVVLTSVILLTR